MKDIDDIRLIISSHIPLIVIESHEELRVIDIVKQIGMGLNKPIFKWSVTEGLERIDMNYAPQKINSQPTDVLRHIKSVSQAGIYVLSDFHPYLDEPVHVRLIKDICIGFDECKHTLVLLSHKIDLPPELLKFSAQTTLSLPSKETLDQLVREVATDWSRQNKGQVVKTDTKTLNMLIKNLSGLTTRDAKRLARNAIYNDGAITQSDLPRVMEAKYKLLSNDGVLSFEYDTAKFSDVGGFTRLKSWLEQRSSVFHGSGKSHNLDKPKGVMLLGVQGCGKSLAAKSVAGTWNVPLLRLDFGALYNRFFGETERNLRESLKTSEAMAPCVLWIDEIEKGISTDSSDSGTSKRVLGTLLTWMAEKEKEVFIVATANDIEDLPPELVRKGRFDEIFFVDLPDADIRQTIFKIHLHSRELDVEKYDLQQLSESSNGFSGAEIEQAVVSALYAAHARNGEVDIQDLLNELAQTKPLSVVMAEKISYLRAWAAERTVPCD